MKPDDRPWWWRRWAHPALYFTGAVLCIASAAYCLSTDNPACYSDLFFAVLFAARAAVLTQEP